MINLRQAFIVATLLALLPAPAAAELPETLPVDQVRPGQTGYGLTVFEGFTISRFKVQVIGVLHNFLPKQDIILMRGEHPELERAGVLGGMSGSPIYINGKLVGALAYGWRFAKEPIFGVTPADNMLALLKRKPLGVEAVARRDFGPPVPGGVASAAGDVEAADTLTIPERRGPGSSAWQSLAARSALMRDRWWRMPGPAPEPSAEQTLVPVAVPLNAAGFAPGAVRQLREAFASFGFEPMQGAGTGQAEGPKTFANGGSIGVQLVSGDMAVSGAGTVTWTDGKQVLAFGHPMLNAGEVYLPMCTFNVAHSLANWSRPFKMGSPARPLGSLVQDRQPGILVDSAMHAPQIPMTVTLRNGDQKNVYRLQLARHRLLTPSLVESVVSNAVTEAMADFVPVAYTMTTRFTIKGYPEVKIVEQGNSALGLRVGGALNGYGLLAVRTALSNPFGPAQIERVDVELDAHYEERPLVITAAAIDANVVSPGKTINVRVTFKPFGGAEFTKSYPLKIPRALAGSLVAIDVASGVSVRPELAPPQNLGQLLKQLPVSYPARAVVIGIRTPNDGLSIRGYVLEDLPQSVLDTMQSGALTRDDKPFKVVARQVFPASRVVIGLKEVRLRVEDED